MAKQFCFDDQGIAEKRAGDDDERFRQGSASDTGSSGGRGNHVYGHLFFAGARTLERILPTVPREIEHPVVILRLRSRRTLGATLVDVLPTYADRLKEVEGRLYVTGVGKEALEHLKRSGRFKDAGEVRAYQASAVVMEATRQAYADAARHGWSASTPTTERSGLLDVRR